jgi:hypothetical protein
LSGTKEIERLTVLVIFFTDNQTVPSLEGFAGLDLAVADHAPDIPFTRLKPITCHLL